MQPYQLEILTPRGKIFSDAVVHSEVPAEDGFVGVLAHHAAYVTSSPGGRFEAKLHSGGTKTFQVGPGFFQFLKNQATLLTLSVTSIH